MDIGKILWAFTNQQDSRDFMKKPVKFMNHLYATNGHMAIQTKDTVDVFDYVHDGKSQSIALRIGKMIAEAPADAIFEPVPEIDCPGAECCACDGTGFLQECLDCEGHGEFKHGSHDYDCKNCGGDGRVPRGHGFGLSERCGYCCGLGKRYADQRLRDARFNGTYLSVIRSLPECVIWINPEPRKCSVFRFSHGSGVIMPMVG